MVADVPLETLICLANFDLEANQMQQLNNALEEVGHCLAQFHFRLLTS